VKRSVIAAASLVLLAAGTASAYAVQKIMLRPGSCTTVHGVKVCARHAPTQTVTNRVTDVVNRTETATVVDTTTLTVTVAPSPIGQTFSGSGSKTLDPMTLPHGVTVHWTSQPDSIGDNWFSVSSSINDTNYIYFGNGNSGATSGSSYVPAGTYTFSVSADNTWTLSF
jgi:hypothetical protein